MRIALCLVLSLGCAPTPVAEVDAAPDDDAAVVLGPIDAGDGLPQFDDICLAADGDAVLGLVANESLACTLGTDAGAPLFDALPTLAPDYHALHALCARMNPDASTRDDLVDAALAADLRAWLEGELTHPALMRAFAGGPSTTDDQIAALMAAWFPQNAFEHVFCGELDPTGVNVWGLHMWSEWALAEQMGRANYLCSTAAIDRHEVVTMRYRWIPEQRTTFATKQVGSFQVGMSPACMLALGYLAVQQHVPDSPASGPAFHAHMYDEETGFAFASQSGAVVTMYATEP